jgi:uncharacterized protein
VNTTTNQGCGRAWQGPQGRRLQQHREEVLGIARRYGASNVRVFGSVGRGEDTEASDIDLLVALPAGDTVLTLAGLAQKLSDSLGTTVEVATPDVLRDEVCEEAIRTAIPLCGRCEERER